MSPPSPTAVSSPFTFLKAGGEVGVNPLGVGGGSERYGTWVGRRVVAPLFDSIATYCREAKLDRKSDLNFAET